jgi:hypothetical protein
MEYATQRKERDDIETQRNDKRHNFGSHEEPADKLKRKDLI